MEVEADLGVRLRSERILEISSGIFLTESDAEFGVRLRFHTILEISTRIFF